MNWQSTLHLASVTVQCIPLFTHKVDCKAMSKVSGLSQRKIARIEDYKMQTCANQFITSCIW